MEKSHTELTADQKERRDFLNYLQLKELSHNSIIRYLSLLKKFQIFLNGRVPNRKILINFIKKNKPYPITRAFLNNFFDFMEIKIDIPKVTGRKKTKIRKSITPQEIKGLRKELYAKDTRFGLLLDLTYFCALRRAEVLGIKVEDLELENYEAGKSLVIKIAEAKGGKERKVVLPPKATDRLIKYLQDNNFDEDESIFPKIDRENWRREFKRAVKKVCSYDYTLHDLRRSRATYWYKKGMDIVSIKNRLGHASINTTQLYINRDQERELNDWVGEYE